MHGWASDGWAFFQSLAVLSVKPASSVASDGERFHWWFLLAPAATIVAGLVAGKIAHDALAVTREFNRETLKVNRDALKTSTDQFINAQNTLASQFEVAQKAAAERFTAEQAAAKERFDAELRAREHAAWLDIVRPVLADAVELLRRETETLQTLAVAVVTDRTTEQIDVTEKAGAEMRDRAAAMAARLRILFEEGTQPLAAYEAAELHLKMATNRLPGARNSRELPDLMSRREDVSTFGLQFRLAALTFQSEAVNIAGRPAQLVNPGVRAPPGCSALTVTYSCLATVSAGTLPGRISPSGTVRLA